MRIKSTSHEHGPSGHVYDYEGDFSVIDDQITWQAEVGRAGDQARSFAGTIKLTSPTIATLAEQVVRDAIVKCIDAFADSHSASAQR